MALVEQNLEVETLAADGPDQSLTVSIRLQRRTGVLGTWTHSVGPARTRTRDPGRPYPASRTSTVIGFPGIASAAWGLLRFRGVLRIEHAPHNTLMHSQTAGQVRVVYLC